MSERAILYRGKIINGRLMFDDPAGERRLYRDLEGRPVLISIEECRPRVSGNQHRYYRGVILKEMERVTGNTARDCHAYNAGEFLYSLDDKGRPFVRSTADLSREEMSEFIERVIAERTKIGCHFISSDEFFYGK